MIFHNISKRALRFYGHKLDSKLDKIGRDVLSEGDRKKIQKNQTPFRLFLDKKSPINISVNRLTPKPGQEPPAGRLGLMSDAELAVIGDQRIVELKRLKKISPKQEFGGWAELSVEDAEQNGRRVFSSPEKNNPSHAEIFLPILAILSKRMRKRHARALAKKAKWRPRPARNGASA